MISRRTSFRIRSESSRQNQVPSWEFRNRRKSFTPRQLARILLDFAYLCWANARKGSGTLARAGASGSHRSLRWFGQAVHCHLVRSHSAFAIVADGFNRTSFHGFLAKRLLLRGGRLLKHI